MPQLIPFYFFNQILFTFIILFSIIFVLSKYILPVFTFTQVIRTYITKLSKKN
jgi:F-type H+-transporting ATPase subunit 8